MTTTCGSAGRVSDEMKNLHADWKPQNTQNPMGLPHPLLVRRYSSLHLSKLRLPHSLSSLLGCRNPQPARLWLLARLR